MQEDRLLGYLGLATKAGKLVTGYNTCLDMIPRGKIKLIILAEDVGEKTKKRFEQKCKSYEIELREGIGADQMSKACGKQGKGIFGITDKGFAKSIIALIDKAESKETVKDEESKREVF
ncbi:MAG: ribosomal L7Ae/L30e/S12e/Gadd45 family protein [Firmicutes bacterium]|nr:ribosomal L7Ae/L30e/S12e/Gadd45 family protein [Bacillota bacterium]